MKRLKRHRLKRWNSHDEKTEELDGEVRSSQLAMQLQARSLYSNQEMKKTFQNIIHLVCEIISDSSLTKGFSQFNPTLLIRHFAGQEFLEGKWITDTVLELWACSEAKYHFIPSPDGRCHKNIPVNITLDENTHEWEVGFLDPLTQIISEQKIHALCENSQFSLIELDGHLWQINQLSGKMKKMAIPKIIKIGTKIWDESMPTLPLQIFRQLIIKNLSQHQNDMMGMIHTFR